MIWTIAAFACQRYHWVSPNPRSACAGAETNLGGTLQLLVDLQYLAGAFSPLVSPAHEAVIGSARDLILTQALESVSSSGAGAGSAQQQLEQWLQGVEVRTTTF